MPQDIDFKKIIDRHQEINKITIVKSINRAIVDTLNDAEKKYCPKTIKKEERENQLKHIKNYGKEKKIKRKIYEPNKRNELKEKTTQEGQQD